METSWVDGGEEVCPPLSPTGGLLVMKSDNDNLCIANVIPEKLQVTMLLVALVARSAHFTL